jgi:Flp pilus assembly protein TadD
MRPLVATLCLISCLLGMWTAVHAGLSRQHSEIGIASAQIASTARALQLAPRDPGAHHAHAVLLAKTGQKTEAIIEFKKAAALRPRDSLLWTDLGRALEQNGDKEAALVAFHEAIRCAPYYAQPRWSLGDLLLSIGRQDEAFAELSRASASYPNLFLLVTELAWKVHQEDPAAVERAVRPRTSEARIQLAQFFVRRGLPNEALALFRTTDGVSEPDREELISALIAGQWFAQAYEVWVSGRTTDGRQPGSGWAVIDNDGFERGDGFNEKGFGWQSPRDAGAVSITLDSFEPREARRSLCLDWKGITNVSVPTLSQLVLVEPSTRYRLSYAARTKDLTTGTPPFIGVLDAGSKDERVLAQSAPLSTGSNPWQESALEFSTGRETRAVFLVLQRPRCYETLCPIFGRVWLDSFSLRKL